MDKYRIEMGELAMAEKVGNGAYGVVWRASWRGSAVAVKQLNAGADRGEFENEIALMCAMKPHRNVLGIVAFCPEPVCALATDFAALGSLDTFLEKSRAGALSPPMTMRRRLSFLRQIALGMAHLHLEKIVHKEYARSFFPFFSAPLWFC
jgi:mitogen-activated protein kinase kinase kinase 7